MGGGRGEIGAAITARREHSHLGAEAVKGAVVELERHDPAAAPLLIHDEVDGKILDEELASLLHRLPIERVQDCVAGAVGGRASALRLAAMAVILGHAAE